LAEAAVKLATEQRRRARVAVVGVILALLLAAFGGYEADGGDLGPVWPGSGGPGGD
jgi:hypothetical protein